MTPRPVEGGISSEIPHLSHSRIDRYLRCPEQYRLYYVENLRPRLAPASLVFGQVLHQALAACFRTHTDPVGTFADIWTTLEVVDLNYGPYDSWEKLAKVGEAVLARFVAEEKSRLGAVEAVEEPFTLRVTSLTVPLIGVIDLVAHLDGVRTVIDFKSAQKGYEAHAVALSDQLTAYAVARPEAAQVALCVFVKTKTPRIEWHVARRTPGDIGAFLQKAEIVGQAIAARHFYKRPGWWCASCDYLPVCLGDQARARATLVRMTPSQAA